MAAAVPGQLRSGTLWQAFQGRSRIVTQQALRPPAPVGTGTCRRSGRSPSVEQNSRSRHNPEEQAEPERAGALSSVDGEPTVFP